MKPNAIKQAVHVVQRATLTTEPVPELSFQGDVK